MRTVHLLIKGKVQGVFFRDSARKNAEELQVRGWIKNNPTGDVEAVISGDNKAVQDFISQSYIGSPRSEVSEIVLKELPFESFSEFRIIR